MKFAFCSDVFASGNFEYVALFPSMPTIGKVLSTGNKMCVTSDVWGFLVLLFVF